MAGALDANGAAQVFIVGRREEQLRLTAETDNNGTIVPLVGDVTSKQSLGRIAAEVAKGFDHLNVLICNTGASEPSSLPPNKEDGTLVTIAEIRYFCWNVPIEELQ